MNVAVFLDYANVNAAADDLNCIVDYGALLDYLADEVEQRSLKVAYAYVPIDPRQEHAMDFEIDSLWKKGYVVKTKVGSIAGESYKCNFDIEMAMDISRVVYEIEPDIVVLVSGDKDFIPIILEMRGKGVRVEVAAFESAMARELALKSSGFISLDYWINEGAEIINDDDVINNDEESLAQSKENFFNDDDKIVKDEEEENVKNSNS